MIGKNLLIIDTLNLCFRFKHTLYKAEDVIAPEWATLEDMVDVMREELAHVYFKEQFMNTVTSLAASYKAKNIICVADLGSSTWRKEIYPEYKADRNEKVAALSITEQAIGKVFMEHYRMLLDDLEKEGMAAIFSPGIEADDIAAYIVLNYSDKYEHTWLVSSDEDWDLLLSQNVSRFNWACKSTWKNVAKTGPRPREITLDNWSEHYIYDRQHHLAMKALQGGEDNIIGVTGVGPKRALDLLNKYGSIKGLLAALPITSSKAAYIRELNASKERIALNLNIMDLVLHNDTIVPIEVKRMVANVI